MRQGGIRQSGYDIRRSHIPQGAHRPGAVSYTHLDVYKRQSQTIPAFETVLELADGRTPLIIELKAEICLLYTSDICI